MKKIDFHIHTVKAISDSMFEFDIESLKKYVEQLELDCIAITNHNLFDKEQFTSICNELGIKVFPGIEIDLEGGHILLISENEDIEDFVLHIHGFYPLAQISGYIFFVARISMQDVPASTLLGCLLWHRYLNLTGLIYLIKTNSKILLKP